MSRVWQVLQLGHRDYDSVHKLQKTLVEARITDKIPDTLIFVEHDPVFTIGKRGTEANILVPEQVLEQEGIIVRRIERGGDVTYHGPGQVVGYPIINLTSYGRDIHNYLRMLEESIIKFLAEFGVKAVRKPPYTGVWIEGGGKIAAIGVAVRKWVTYHGFCFNIAPNMKHFAMINPCGLGSNTVTSLKDLGIEMDYVTCCKMLADKICDVFECQMEWVSEDAFATLA